MEFKTKLVLLGVVGKKGSGTLDNGQSWQTDRVELHCLSEFQDNVANAHGSTIVVHQLQDFDTNYSKSLSFIGQEVLVTFVMSPSAKPGQAPKILPIGIELNKK